MTTRKAGTTRRARLALEDPEGRLAPAIFTVTNTNDGAGSLRQAIESLLAGFAGFGDPIGGAFAG